MLLTSPLPLFILIYPSLPPFTSILPSVRPRRVTPTGVRRVTLMLSLSPLYGTSQGHRRIASPVTGVLVTEYVNVLKEVYVTEFSVARDFRRDVISKFT